jgi:hypothetical protein
MLGVEPPAPAAPIEPFAALTADLIAPIIPTAWAAYPIKKGMFCGKPILAVFAAPAAVETVASEALNDILPKVFLASATFL